MDVEEAKQKLSDLQALQDSLYGKINRAEARLAILALPGRTKLWLGKCFKYRSSYSCPAKRSDYWWEYFQVVKVTTDEYITHNFSKDSYGLIRFNFKHVFYYKPERDRGYIPISLGEYTKVYIKLRVNINNLLSKKGR